MDGIGFDISPAPEASRLAASMTGLAGRSSAGSGLIDRQASFREVMSIANRGGDARAGETPEQRARWAAEQLVSITFVQPILAQVREAKDAAPPFAPTSAEKQFGSLMDARMAHEIVHGARLPMVERLARDLLARSGERKEASP